MENKEKLTPQETVEAVAKHLYSLNVGAVKGVLQALVGAGELAESSPAMQETFAVLKLPYDALPDKMRSAFQIPAHLLIEIVERMENNENIEDS